MAGCAHISELQLVLYVLKVILAACFLHISDLSSRYSQNKYSHHKGTQAGIYACRCAFCDIQGIYSVGCRSPPVNRFDLLNND